MKKTLVALAVAATAMVATSANAVTVYEQDGTKVELKGSLRTFLGRVGDDQRGDLKNDGSRIHLKGSHDLGNGLSAFGGYQLRFDESTYNSRNAQRGSRSNFGNPSTRELYVGLAHKDVGALSLGRQNTNADDFLSDAAYYGSADLSPLTTRSDKSVKFRSAEWNGFSFGLDYLFGDDDKTNTGTATTVGNYKNGYGAVLFYTYDIAEGHSVNARALYTQDKYEGAGAGPNSATSSSTALKVDQFGFRLGYVFGPFDIAASYVHYDNDFKDSFSGVAPLVSDFGIEGDSKGNYILVDAGYRVIEPSRLYVQWERLDAKQDNADATDAIANRYTAGIDYKFTKNVVPYVQYTHQRIKYAGDVETDKDNIFGVGLRVHF